VALHTCQHLPAGTDEPTATLLVVTALPLVAPGAAVGLGSAAAVHGVAATALALLCALQQCQHVAAGLDCHARPVCLCVFAHVRGRVCVLKCVRKCEERVCMHCLRRFVCVQAVGHMHACATS